MARLKKPLLSFKAHGSLGNSLTFQDRDHGTIVRKKPTPFDPKTLAQMYHRWLYQDYAAWWLTLSAAEKVLWETNARRFKITGFNYWMRSRLSNLPDFASGFHLDRMPGSTAVDFSKNANHGIVYGPSLVPGLIDSAFYFDGINDFVQTGLSSSLDITHEITLEAFAKREAVGDTFILSKWKIATAERAYGLGYDAFNNVVFYRSSDGDWHVGEILKTGVSVDTTFHHLLATQDGTNAYILIDGVVRASGAHVQLNSVPSLPLELGRYNDGGYQEGIIDQVHVYNRSLDLSDAQRHSERRYPL